MSLSMNTNPKLVIEAIREEASKSPAFNAVCHIFAIRERARQQVTLANLRLIMQREGFNYTRDQYVQVLQKLASFGVGALDYDSNKHLRSLKNIRYTLQSVGLAAVGRKDNFERFNPQATFKDLPVQPQPRPQQPPQPQPQAPASPVPLKARSYPATLTVVVEGLPLTLNLPKALTAKELSILLDSLKGGN